jgi:hypothetical protein
MGAHFDSSHPTRPEVNKLPTHGDSKDRNCFELHAQKYVLRIRERIEQEFVPGPSALPVTGRTQPVCTYRPPDYRYISTGKLFLAVVSIVSSYDCQKTEDAPASKVEAKMLNLVRRLEEQSIRHKLEQEISRQRELDRRMKSEAWEKRKTEKDMLLNRLAAFEKMAHDLDRAESLRRLGERVRTSPAAPAELAASLDQLTLMANWLDPLVKAAWPELDEVPEKNPFGRIW